MDVIKYHLLKELHYQYRILTKYKKQIKLMYKTNQIMKWIFYHFILINLKIKILQNHNME